MVRNTKDAGTRSIRTLSVFTFAFCLFTFLWLAPASASGPSPFSSEVPQHFTGLKRLEVKALLVKQGVLYAGTGDGLYSRSSEGMSEWTVVTKGLDDVLVHAVAMAHDQTLYVGTSGKGILRYAPRAHEWQRVTHGLMDHEGLRENFIRVLAIDKDEALYAGTFDGGGV